MTRTPRRYELFVGIDISAKSAVVAWCGADDEQLDKRLFTPTSVFTIEQTPAGFAQLQRRLETTDVLPAATLIVLEATSTYWIRLASALHEAGYGVSVINPKQAHDFAKAVLQRAKTDALDAQVLAQLAMQLQPACWNPPPRVYHELRQRLAQRDTLQTLRQQIINQQHALAQEVVIVEPVAARQAELVAVIDKQITQVERELREVVEQDGEWAGSITRLQSIPGIGLVTSAWLVVATLNFTTCSSAEAVTSYAGLAPYPKQSGSSVRGRAYVGHSGDGRLRRALFMATLSAAQCNPTIKDFYDRLRQAGKPTKVARCAAARKLLHIAFAVAKKQQVFDADYHKPVMSRSTPS